MVPEINFLDYLNPLRYFTPGEYISFWYVLFHTLLQGFWAKFFSVSSFILSFWFIARRQNVYASVIFLFLAALTAYAGGIWMHFK